MEVIVNCIHWVITERSDSVIYWYNNDIMFQDVLGEIAITGSAAASESSAMNIDEDW